MTMGPVRPSVAEDVKKKRSRAAKKEKVLISIDSDSDSEKMDEVDARSAAASSSKERTLSADQDKCKKVKQEKNKVMDNSITSAAVKQDPNLCNPGEDTIHERNSKHNGGSGEVFTCQICRKTFSTILLVKKHLVRKHLPSKQSNQINDVVRPLSPIQNNLNFSSKTPFSCIKCSKEFKLRHGLNVHLKLKRCYDESGVLPSTSSHLGNGAGSALRENLIISDKLKLPFLCVKCNKSFKLRHGLNMHLKQNRCYSEQENGKSDVSKKKKRVANGVNSAK